MNRPTLTASNTRMPSPAFIGNAALGLALLLVAGCASSGVKNPSGTGVTEVQADEKGFVVGTGVESQDLVAVSEKMARGILSLPAIQSAVTPPVIIMDPVVNDTRFPLNKDIFLTRIRVLLSTRAAGKATFVARDRMAALQKEQELKQTGQVSGTPETAFKGGDYLLTGTLQGLTTRTSRGTSDYVLYNFQLVDFHTSAIVWEDFAEIKKQGLEDAAYR